MAHIAFFSSDNMVSRFAGRCCAVMAARTRAQHLSMVHSGRRDECCGAMAGFAHIRRVDVSDGFTDRIYAIVAA